MHYYVLTLLSEREDREVITFINKTEFLNNACRLYHPAAVQLLVLVTAIIMSSYFKTFIVYGH